MIEVDPTAEIGVYEYVALENLHRGTVPMPRSAPVWLHRPRTREIRNSFFRVSSSWRQRAPILSGPIQELSEFSRRLRQLLQADHVDEGRRRLISKLIRTSMPDSIGTLPDTERVYGEQRRYPTRKH
jgi:hypothetical protein